MNLSKNVKITVVSPAAIAAQTAINSSILDQQGFDGVMFVALLGDVTVNSVLTLTAQQNVINSASGMAAVGATTAFTAGASDADSKVLMLDLHRAAERFVRCVLTRTAANAVLGGIVSFQYDAASAPTTHDASVIAEALLIAPSET